MTDTTFDMAEALALVCRLSCGRPEDQHHTILEHADLARLIRTDPRGIEIIKNALAAGNRHPDPAGNFVDHYSRAITIALKERAEWVRCPVCDTALRRRPAGADHWGYRLAREAEISRCSPPLGAWVHVRTRRG
jgi:hypothetical protein